ncbi:hypothetical protein FHS96_002580 [Sphingomonas zeicaulis]|uniref:hypothetical protein n=1 Tax=Sphingomonas zeicaulis TaxID=1632740 RepID=UPI003D1986FB
MEADEAWEYDDDRHIQTLKGVVALCPDCHHVRHWGKSLVDGREEEVTRHLMTINGWTRAEVKDAADAAFEQWEARSRHVWQSEYGWVTRTHGIVPDEIGFARAEAANQDLVGAARKRAADTFDQYGDQVHREELLGIENSPASAHQAFGRRLIDFSRSLVQ